MALLLKVFILGVPTCKPNVRVLIRCPTSGLGGAGCGGCRGGPWGTQPPSGHTGVGDGDMCPGGTHPSPLRKVTSQSSPLRFPLPDGFPHGVGGGLLGCAFSSQSAISHWRSSMSWHSSWSVRLPSSAWRWHGVSPLGWGLSGGEWGSPSLYEDGD